MKNLRNSFKTYGIIEKDVYENVRSFGYYISFNAYIDTYPAFWSDLGEATIFVPDFCAL